MKTTARVLLLAAATALSAQATGASLLEDDPAFNDPRDLLEAGAETVFEEDYLADRIVQKHFLVVGTFRTHGGAAAAAARLVHPTGLRLESETLELADGQPSYARDVCELNGWDYPCYVARGRFDDGAYLSVEPSDAYTGMRPGYFVVIAASGSRQDVLAEQMELARRGIRGYVSTSEVWLGCIH